LLLPIADGTIETSTLFEIDASVKKKGATLMKLENVKRIEDDVLCLNYKLNPIPRIKIFIIGNKYLTLNML